MRRVGECLIKFQINEKSVHLAKSKGYMRKINFILKNIYF